MSTPEETASQLEQAQAALEKAQADHAAAVAKAEDARPPEEQILDLLDLLVARLGNRPPMLVLLNRLRARVLNQTQSPPAAPPDASGSSEVKAA